MRNLYIRFQLPHNLLFFGSIARFEKLRGMNSNIGGGLGHFVFIDCDEVELNALVRWVREAQTKWDLGQVYITADSKTFSYRVWCFTTVSFRELMRIICDCPYVDVDFIRWTARKGHATMRLSTKADRDDQQIVATVYNGLRKDKLPYQVEVVDYETPRGQALRLGYEVMADG